jgi:hypothetical protein
MERREAAAILSQLRRDARVIAERFDLSYRDIVAEHPRVTSRYGVCYQDGLIKIRLNHARTSNPLKYSSLVDTLCHELAHLRHFNHGPEFKAFFIRLLSWARSQGIYRPRSVAEDAAATPRKEEIPALSVQRRNGVPVFPVDLPRTRTLPWTSSTAGPTTEPAARPTTKPTTGPVSARPEKTPPVQVPPAPVQLSLF